MLRAVRTAMLSSRRARVILTVGLATLVAATPVSPMQTAVRRPAASRRPPAAPVTSTAKPASASPPASTDTVAGRAWVAAEGSEGATRLWAAIENRQNEPISDVSFVDFDAPGFVRVGRCWDPAVQRSWPSCHAGATIRDTGPWTIAPHSTAVWWADVMRESPDAGHFVVGGVFEWTDTTGRHRGQLQTAALDLASIRRPLGIPPAWLDFTKDLFLPVTLLVLGFIWQRLQQRRTDRQAVWSTMLEKSHANAERYYMPIDSAIMTFASSVDEVKKLATTGSLTPDAFDEATLWLLLLVKRNRIFLKKIGGYYFKNRIGESIAADCWELIFLRTLKPLMTRVLLDSAVEDLEPFSTQADLRALCTKSAAYNTNYQNVRSKLMQWAGFDSVSGTLNYQGSALEVDMHILDLWSIVLEVEMNRPEKLWYDDGWFWSAPKWTVTSDDPVSRQLDDAWVKIERLKPAWVGIWPAEKGDTVERIGSALKAYKRQLRD
jgi:hypothetical protein